MNEDIIYLLNIEDLQTVSKQTLKRELTPEEILMVKELVPEKINWFDAIESAIMEKIDS